MIRHKKHSFTYLFRFINHLFVIYVLTEITRVIREEPKEELTEHDLEKVHDITLTETDTIWILDIPGVCVSLESEEAEEIKEQNERYAEVRGRGEWGKADGGGEGDGHDLDPGYSGRLCVSGERRGRGD